MFNRIICVPHKLGQNKIGVDKTPIILKYFFSKNNTFFKLENTNNFYYNLKHLYQINNSFNEPRINIGGDHSMSIATVANTINRFPNTKIIWIDAHADINTFESSKSKNYHGMPLGFLTGLCKDNNFNYIKNLVPFRNIIFVGVRELDNFENYIIKKENINIITIDDIQTNYNRSLGRILDFVRDDNIHLSFDVDVMDPNIIPSTGTPVPNGLELNEAKCLLDALLVKNNLFNIDITELNLELGTTKDKIKSLNNTMYLFENYLN